MPIDNPTRQIVYKILPPTSYEDIPERWTADEVDARAAYDRGYFVHKYDIVKSGVSAGQEITTGLATEWRGR